MKHAAYILLFILTLLVGCTEVECPLDNVVEMTCTVYDIESGKKVKIYDTLTVKIAGSDSTLYNRGVGFDEFAVPLGYTSSVDTLLCCLSNKAGQSAVDTIFVSHEKLPHFESVDCPVVVFHRISHVAWTSHSLSVMPLTIDSIALIQSKVAYEDIENLRIFMRTLAD